MGIDARKPVFGSLTNNKGADQPSYLRSLISAIFICLLESLISKIAISEISIFELVSVHVADLNLASSETPKTGFVASRPIHCSGIHLQ